MRHPAATISEVRRFIDSYGHHGYLYTSRDGRWTLEHTDGAGHWGACILAVAPHAPGRAIDQAAMRHLFRKAHRGPIPQQLAGTAHAGGGELVNGQLVKGPQR